MDILGRYFMAVIGVLMGVIIPITSLFARTDDMIQKYVENATNTFVDEAKQMGYISPSNYLEFTSSLSHTGYLYTVNIEHGSLIAYPDGEGEYKDHHIINNKNDILSEMFPTNATEENDYVMKSGDELQATVEISEPTITSKISNGFSLSPRSAQKIIRYYYGVTIGNTKR